MLDSKINNKRHINDYTKFIGFGLSTFYWLK